MPDDFASDQEAPEFTPPVEGEGDLTETVEAPEIDSGEVETPEVAMFDVKLDLSEEDKKKIVGYLEDNLPKLKPSQKEVDRILSYLGMYEMSVKKRGFPYEGAPSLSSSDAHEALNEWLDTAEVAFLQNRVTFTIDREEVSLSEDAVSRIEKTYHRKFFLKHFSRDLRLTLFEASFLGAAIKSVREEYDIRPVKENIVIRNEKQLAENKKLLTKAEYLKAEALIQKDEFYVCSRDSLKILNIGPRVGRIDQTKFWYPRNSKDSREWQIVAEQEFYTKSALLEMVHKGELDEEAVDACLATRKALYSNYIDNTESSEEEKSRLPSDLKYNADLDSSEWKGEINQIQELGDSYEDEFAVYRVTMLYNLPTEKDTQGNLRSWIEVLFCPAGCKILSANFCQEGFPYFLIQYRPVPYRALGAGIAQERYHHNILDTECKSYFLAAIEQEMGAPLLIRKQSSLYASGFRAYPASVAYVDNVDQDAKFMPFPEKSRLAVQGMSMILGSSPSANRGAGYNSGKREELMQNKEMAETKSRIHSIAIDLDQVFNAAWRVHCRMAKFNTKDRKVIDWVYETQPVGTKLYVLESEMQSDIYWSSVLSAVSLTPDARLGEFLRKFQFFYKEVPSLQSNPEKTINWLMLAADYFGIDESMRSKLIPSMQDFQQYQQQLGAMGGQNQQASTTPEAAQSSSTPFSRPKTS